MAATNSAVMAEFRERAEITNQAIALRSGKLLTLVKMPRDIATYVAASRAGVRIDKHLDKDTVREVAEYDALVHAKEQTADPAVIAKPAKGGKAAKAGTEVEFPNFKVPPGTLSAQQVKNATKMAAQVYPLLYAFENSVREFVHGHLTAEYGKDWWDRPQLVKKSIRESVERTKKASGRHRWVERKNAPPIYYAMLGDLSTIMVSNDGWKVFTRFFDSKSWVEERVASFEVPRNVVAHMNLLLAKNIKGLEVRGQEWFDQIKGHPPPST